MVLKLEDFLLGCRATVTNNYYTSPTNSLILIHIFLAHYKQERKFT
jgi:hypothetical protein